MDNEQEWIEGDLRNVPDTDEEFEATLFLSTDRKLTISVKASTRASRKAAVTYAQNVYSTLMQKYGGKQEAAVKAYAKPASAHENPEGWCNIHNSQMRQYTKNGKSWYSHQVDGAWCTGK